MSAAVVIEPLSGSHHRSDFSCGVPALDKYFHEKVSQDVRRRLGNCFVAINQSDKLIAGYYTLSASSVALASLPESETKRLPRYPILPAALIGRLAVDRRYQGQQIGSSLIMDAVRRSAESAPAAFTLIVDAKDENAAAFYRKHGFMRLQSHGNSLFLPIENALKLIS